VTQFQRKPSRAPACSGPNTTRRSFVETEQQLNLFPPPDITRPRHLPSGTYAVAVGYRRTTRFTKRVRDEVCRCTKNPNNVDAANLSRPAVVWATIYGCRALHCRDPINWGCLLVNAPALPSVFRLLSAPSLARLRFGERSIRAERRVVCFSEVSREGDVGSAAKDAVLSPCMLAILNNLPRKASAGFAKHLGRQYLQCYVSVCCADSLRFVHRRQRCPRPKICWRRSHEILSIFVNSFWHPLC